MSRTPLPEGAAPWLMGRVGNGGFLKAIVGFMTSAAWPPPFTW